MSQGSCLCGEVKYTFTGEPLNQALCHCLPCRKVSGSTNTTNIIVPTTNFTITNGESKLKSFTTMHPSGMNLTLRFCTNCGSMIYKTVDGDAFRGTVVVQAGSLDPVAGGMSLEDVKIGAELWIPDRVEWLNAREGTAQCQGFA